MNKNSIIKILIGVLIFIAALIGIFAIINYNLSSESHQWLDGGSWVALIIGSFSAGATLILGYVAYWQNNKQREDNLRAQRQLEQKDQENKIAIENRYKFDALLNNQHKYLERLESINNRLIDIDFMNETLKIAKISYDLISNAYIDSKINSCLEEIEKRVSRLVVLINHIQNTVTYNRYYLPEVEDLVITLVKFRSHMEYISLKYFGASKNSFNPLPLKETEGDFKKDIFKAMELAGDSFSYWNIYLQSCYLFIEEIECNYNLEMLTDRIRKNCDNTIELRKKVEEMRFKEK